MRRATGKPEATQLTIEYRVYRSQQWNCKMHGDKTTSQNLSRCSRKISIRNNSFRTWVRSKRSTGSARNHKNYSSTWTPQRSSNFSRTLQKNPSPDCNSFTEIRIIYCSYKRSPATTKEANCDFSSVLGFVMKKNSSRGPEHGQSERQIVHLRRNAACLQIASHQDASHCKAQGNMDPFGLVDVDRFTPCPTCEKNSSPGSIFCECRKMLPEIHEPAKDRVQRCMQKNANKMLTPHALVHGRQNLTRTSTGGTTNACKNSQHWKRLKQLGSEGCGHRWKKDEQIHERNKKTVLQKVVLSPNKHWRNDTKHHKGTSRI